MNIWIFNHYAITPELSGGTRHFDFAKELTERGYNVTIFASSFHYSLLRETKYYGKSSYIIEDYDGIRFVWIGTFPYSKNDWRRVLNMLSYSVGAYKTAKKINIEKPNVIIGSSVHLFSVYTAYLLSKHFNIPFIMEVRDLWPQTLIDMGVSRWNPFVILLGILEKFLYKRAKKIISLLPKAYEYITSLGIPLEKIVWIPNGVDLKKFENIEGNFGKRTKFKVLYAGAHGIANGLDTLLNSARILKEKGYSGISIELVGDGPEKQRLMKRTLEEGLDNVSFRDPVKKDKIPKVLSEADVLFFNLLAKDTFKYGISSNKLFDYLSSGRPVIFASNASNNPVEEAKAGITVPPENPEAIAEAIINLYKMNEEERFKMGNNGKKYVEKYHSIPVLVDKLETVIQEALTAAN
ncbi:MAG TPA: glycosyltransferase WbuB [Deltaproteobacteria bacterium]|nr:glycosyltransferase WbuB [Deltaproteobacteria bacterium]